MFTSVYWGVSPTDGVKIEKMLAQAQNDSQCRLT